MIVPSRPTRINILSVVDYALDFTICQKGWKAVCLTGTRRTRWIGFKEGGLLINDNLGNFRFFFIS